MSRDPIKKFLFYEAFPSSVEASIGSRSNRDHGRDEHHMRLGSRDKKFLDQVQITTN